MAPEGFEDFRDRVQAERAVREQRDAAERRVPGERLRREINEAFTRLDAREEDDARATPDARRAPDAGTPPPEPPA